MTDESTISRISRISPISPISRRRALHLTVAACASAAGGAFLLACGKKEDKARALSCLDTSGLAEPDVQMRSNLRYVDHSAEASKNCANCMQFVAPAAPGSCGGCKLLKGPIHPEGYCLSWAAKSV